MKKTIEQLRAKIDELDDKIVDLLVQRYDLVNGIGDAKKEAGTPVRDDSRESRVLSRVRDRTRKPLSKAAAERIYRAILEESRGLQSKKTGSR